MKILGLIPARAGSERCPGKNHSDLGGKPLIMWSIDAAKNSAIFDTLAVTTDDQTISEIAMKAGCLVIKRPAELSNSDVPMLPVVQHASDLVQSDLIVLLQPTSPFRSSDDIIQAVKLIKNSNGEAVVSVTDAPSNEVFEIGHAYRMRQKLNTVVPNGAIYIIKTEYLKQKGDWYSGVSYAYQMPKQRSLDIDTKMDLEMARWMVENHHKLVA